MKRICLSCKHWRFISGSPDLSEMTPGWDTIIMCTKGHWKINNYDCDETEFRRYMARAKDCPDYVHFGRTGRARKEAKDGD